MWAVVGLGNPGRKYSRTRHNVGFMVIEGLAEKHGVELRQKPLYAIGRAVLGGDEALLLEPLTFMNRSGAAVGEVSRKFGIPPERLIIVHDDLDMEPGRVKVKAGGGSGGHNGVDSVIQGIGSREFIRVKLGIGRDESTAPEEYVLRKFNRSQLPAVRSALTAAREAVETIIAEGVEQAMNVFNKKA